MIASSIITAWVPRGRVLARQLAGWTMRRARERSTWIGLAAMATALGKSVWADHLTSAADVVPMVLGAGGAALAAASTKSRPQGADTTTKDSA